MAGQLAADLHAHQLAGNLKLAMPALPTTHCQEAAT